MSQSWRTRRGARAPHRRLVLCAGITLGATLAGAWPAAAGALTTTFLFTGAEQKFVVPTGVTSVHVLAVGGRGGNGLAPGGGPGGAPAEVSGELGVFAGQTLYVEVGGVGTDAGLGIVQAFNGGTFGGEGTAGGGGASDVRLASRPEPDTPTSLFSRLIVAAGGGGGGAGSEGTLGGAGGQAASAGASANGGLGGGGGTAERGGASPCGGCEGKLGSGAEGSVGLAGSAGGGGGGGLFGGAGGTTNATNTGAGGGGGSSLQPAGGSTVVPALAAAPEVQISYTPPTATSGGAGGNPTPSGTTTPSSTSSNAFSLLRPIVGVGDSITLVLDLPGKGTATAVATATRTVTARLHGKRVHKKLRFAFGSSRATVTASGALELTIKPSAAGRKALASHKPLPVVIAVAFVPADGAGSTQKLSVTLPRRSRASR